jgi:hypothetical protein
LFNYGLNKKEDFTAQDLKVYNPSMLQDAKRDLLVRLINMYTLRGMDVADLQQSLAKIGAKVPTGQPPLPPPVTPVTSEDQTPEKETEEIETEEPGGENPPDDLGGTGYE